MSPQGTDLLVHIVASSPGRGRFAVFVALTVTQRSGPRSILVADPGLQCINAVCSLLLCAGAQGADFNLRPGALDRDFRPPSRRLRHRACRAWRFVLSPLSARPGGTFFLNNLSHESGRPSPGRRRVTCRALRRPSSSTPFPCALAAKRRHATAACTPGHSGPKNIKPPKRSETSARGP